MRENNPVRSVGGRARSVEESSRKVDDPSDVLGVKPESAKETTVIQASNDHEVQERSGKMERPLNGGDKSVRPQNKRSHEKSDDEVCETSERGSNRFSTPETGPHLKSLNQSTRSGHKSKHPTKPLAGAPPSPPKSSSSSETKFSPKTDSLSPWTRELAPINRNTEIAGDLTTPPLSASSSQLQPITTLLTPPLDVSKGRNGGGSRSKAGTAASQQRPSSCPPLKSKDSPTRPRFQRLPWEPSQVGERALFFNSRPGGGKLIRNLFPGKRTSDDLLPTIFDDRKRLQEFQCEILPVILRCIERSNSRTLLGAGIVVQLVCTGEKSHPTILVICSSDRAVRRIQDLFRKAPGIYDKNYYHLHVVNDGIKRTRHEVLGWLDLLGRPDVGYCSQLNGVSIEIGLDIGCRQGSGENEAVSPVSATLGGIVLIDGVLYGLTARHVLGLDSEGTGKGADAKGNKEGGFSGRPTTGKHCGISSAMSPVNIQDDEGSDGIDEQSSFSSASSVSSSSESENEEERQVDDLKISCSMALSRKEYIAISPGSRVSTNVRRIETLGFIDKSLSGSADHPFSYSEDFPEAKRYKFDGDWALIKLEQHDIKFLPNIVFIADVSPDSSAAENRVVALTEILPIPKSTKEPVLALAGHSGITAGTLLGAMSSIKLPGRRTFTDAYCIQILNESNKLTEGDSGSWIVDESYTGVYGQVYAACEKLPYAYAIPLQAIFSDIKDKLNMEPKLPGWVEMAERARTRTRMAPTARGMNAVNSRLLEYRTDNQNESERAAAEPVEVTRLVKIEKRAEVDAPCGCDHCEGHSDGQAGSLLPLRCVPGEDTSVHMDEQDYLESPQPMTMDWIKDVGPEVANTLLEVRLEIRDENMKVLERQLEERELAERTLELEIETLLSEMKELEKRGRRVEQGGSTEGKSG